MSSAGSSSQFSLLPAAIAGALLFSSSMPGCGTPRERYRVLSTIFDGVPDPDAPPKPVRGPQNRATVGPAGGPTRFVTQHRPVALGQCGRCHADAAKGDDTWGFTDIDPYSRPKAKGLCVKCHSTEQEVSARAVVTPKGAWLHGPVAAEQCLLCHWHHESPNPKLLREPRAETLCLRCHDHLAKRTGPMAKLDCFACHDPHKSRSPSERFLKGGGPTGVCVTCHVPGGTAKAPFDPKETPWVHGPVANGLCVRCHDAHGGDEKHVRRPIRDVCLSCHDATKVTLGKAHGGEAGTRECDTCHDPHAAGKASDHFVRRK